MVPLNVLLNGPRVTVYKAVIGKHEWFASLKLQATTLHLVTDLLAETDIWGEEGTFCEYDITLALNSDVSHTRDIDKFEKRNLYPHFQVDSCVLQFIPPTW